MRKNETRPDRWRETGEVTAKPGCAQERAAGRNDAVLQTNAKDNARVVVAVASEVTGER